MAEMRGGIKRARLLLAAGTAFGDESCSGAADALIQERSWSTCLRCARGVHHRAKAQFCAACTCVVEGCGNATLDEQHFMCETHSCEECDCGARLSLFDDDNGTPTSTTHRTVRMGRRWHVLKTHNQRVWGDFINHVKYFRDINEDNARYNEDGIESCCPATTVPCAVERMGYARSAECVTDIIAAPAMHPWMRMCFACQTSNTCCFCASNLTSATAVPQLRAARACDECKYVAVCAFCARDVVRNVQPLSGRMKKKADDADDDDQNDICDRNTGDNHTIMCRECRAARIRCLECNALALHGARGLRFSRFAMRSPVYNSRGGITQSCMMCTLACEKRSCRGCPIHSAALLAWWQMLPAVEMCIERRACNAIAKRPDVFGADDNLKLARYWILCKEDLNAANRQLFMVLPQAAQFLYEHYYSSTTFLMYGTARLPGDVFRIVLRMLI